MIANATRPKRAAVEFRGELKSIDSVALAHACGVPAYRCSQPGDVEPALRKAYSHDGICLVEMIVHPKEWPVKPEDV